ncbi:Phospholipase/carboxylesterase [Beijerinckiaceae bacterium RH AL1]|nr:prolyl oligopeptidase family serine peptidase [Beijerinckiaceae bacterium]VVB48261.1 Phospholipase/carboxylesterase [Beijerinckiaceae bacterium RH CH11]VVB48342.1 Phospholipase/carboxylesterase [Beijerinckiaceae bacterium RH AL8]VVC56305.1 Phospholipase/carboxylesterase [Beijerinckiaceae bacterium RH AL1]
MSRNPLLAAPRRAFLATLLLWTGAAEASDVTMLAHEPTQKTAHPPLIVLLHGAGADERDMVSMWRDLPPDFVVVSPRGPFRDGGGFSWYRKTSRAADIALSRKIVELIVQKSVERFDADPRRVFLGGFSQGGVMTYEVALHDPERFAGAVVLSGSMFPSALAGVASVGLAHDPFFIGHGTADPRIPIAAATAARSSLEHLGVPVAFHAYPGMGHATNESETQDLAAWLAARSGG